jgi:hypothetical protein
MSPQPKAASNSRKQKLEVILPTAVSKKHSVRFETSAEGVDLNNIYLKSSGVQKLGNPKAVKVTVEAVEPE